MTDIDEKPKPTDTNYRFIGKPIVRKEDERLTTGRGRFTDDFKLPGQVYAVMVRSPYPHARIRGVDAARARGIGIILVEQSLPLALAVGDRFYVMENGQIVASFDRIEVAADPDRLTNMLTVE